MRPTTRLRSTVLGCLAAVMVLAGCSGGSTDSLGAATEDAGATRESAAGDQAKAPAGADQTSTDVTPTSAYLVRTAALSMTSDDLGAARADLSALLARVGGYVVDESSRADDEGVLQSVHVVLAVPTERYTDVLRDLGEIATVTSIEESTDDVEQEVVDVNSRVASARIALDRMQDLLDRATDLSDIIEIEQVLAERQASLESLLAQQKSLARQTQMATITVDLRPATPEVEAEPEDAGFLAGLDDGWDAMTSAFTAGSTVVGAVLPFALLLALLGLPVLAYARRHRRATEPAPS